MAYWLQKIFSGVGKPVQTQPTLTYQDIVKGFFTSMSYEPSKEEYLGAQECDEEVKKAFERETPSLQLGHILPSIMVGCETANFMYPPSSMELKVYIAVYTALLVYLEDTQAANIHRLLDFAHVFSNSQSHGDVHYDHFARLLREDTPKLFGPYATSCIIKTSLGFVTSTALEYRFPRGFSRVPNEFPYWLRYSTGAGESYAWFNFPSSLFPEDEYLGGYITSIGLLSEYINTTNDILSYYKELVVGQETNNYFSSQARASGCSTLETLATSCTRLDTVNQKLKWLLKPYPSLLQAYESFREGYIVFHCASLRYRLHEASVGVKKAPYH